jgi:hypothetical protein
MVPSRLLVEDDGVGVVGKVKSTGEGLPLLRAFSENLKWAIVAGVHGFRGELRITDFGIVGGRAARG